MIELHVAERAENFQSTGPHRLEMSTSREERDICAEVGEPRPEVAADSARSDDRDLHRIDAIKSPDYNQRTYIDRKQRIA